MTPVPIRPLSMWLSVMALMSASWALSSAAPSAEQEPAPVAAPRYEHVVKWRHAQSFAERSAVVAMVKVLEASRPAGTGWKEGGDDGDGGARGGWVTIDLKQEVRVEVIDVLRGKLAGKTLPVALGRIRLDSERLPDGDRLEAGRFGLEKGGEYLVFLEEPSKAPDGSERATHVERAGPVLLPNAPLVASVRGYCRLLDAWDRAADPTAEEKEVIAGHIAGLSSDEEATRKQCELLLSAVGMKARRQLEAAAKDADAAKADAAKQALKKIAPQAGVAEYPVVPGDTARGASFYYVPLADALLREKGADARIVVVGKVVRAGEASGAGWDPSKENDPGPKAERISQVDVTQNCELEVVEVLRGRLEAKRIDLSVKPIVMRHWHLRNYFFSIKPLPIGFGLPLDHFVLRQGESYILCLAEPKAEAVKDGKAAMGLAEGTWPLSASPEAAGAFRAWGITLASWDDPGALSPEEEAAVAKQIAALDADDFDRREAADAALRAQGVRARPQLEKAAQDKAFERSRRAADILADLRPAPGKTVLPWKMGADFYKGTSWDAGQLAASRSALVVVGKVLEPGRIAGAGWKMKEQAEAAAENADPELAGTEEIDLRQDARVEVVEVLRGELPGNARQLAVRLDKLRVEGGKVNTLWYKRNAHATASAERRLPAMYFSLQKGETCIFFLNAPGEGGVAVHLASCHPARDPDADLLASVRNYCRRVKDWNRPRELTAEEEARARALIADLASDDFDRREEAESRLKAMGAAVRAIVEEAAKDQDPERSERAAAILKALTPKVAADPLLDPAAGEEGKAGEGPAPPAGGKAVRKPQSE